MTTQKSSKDIRSISGSQSKSISHFVFRLPSVRDLLHHLGTISIYAIFLAILTLPTIFLTRLLFELYFTSQPEIQNTVINPIHSHDSWYGFVLSVITSVVGQWAFSYFIWAVSFDNLKEIAWMTKWPVSVGCLFQIARTLLPPLGLRPPALIIALATLIIMTGSIFFSIRTIDLWLNDPDHFKDAPQYMPPTALLEFITSEEIENTEPGADIENIELGNEPIIESLFFTADSPTMSENNNNNSLSELHSIDEPVETKMVIKNKYFPPLAMIVLAVSGTAGFVWFNFIPQIFYNTDDTNLKVITRIFIHPLIAEFAVTPWRLLASYLNFNESRGRYDNLLLFIQFFIALSGRFLVTTLPSLAAQILVSAILSIEDGWLRSHMLHRDRAYLSLFLGYKRANEFVQKNRYLYYFAISSDEIAEAEAILVSAILVAVMRISNSPNSRVQSTLGILGQATIALLLEEISDFSLSLAAVYLSEKKELHPGNPAGPYDSRTRRMSVYFDVTSDEPFDPTAGSLTEYIRRSIEISRGSAEYTRNSRSIDRQRKSGEYTRNSRSIDRQRKSDSSEENPNQNTLHPSVALSSATLQIPPSPHLLTLDSTPTDELPPPVTFGTLEHFPTNDIEMGNVLGLVTPRVAADIDSDDDPVSDVLGTPMKFTFTGADEDGPPEPEPENPTVDTNSVTQNSDTPIITIPRSQENTDDITESSVSDNSSGETDSTIQYTPEEATVPDEPSSPLQKPPPQMLSRTFSSEPRISMNILRIQSHESSENIAQDDTKKKKSLIRDPSLYLGPSGSIGSDLVSQMTSDYDLVSDSSHSPTHSRSGSTASISESSVPPPQTEDDLVHKVTLREDGFKAFIYDFFIAFRYRIAVNAYWSFQQRSKNYLLVSAILHFCALITWSNLFLGGSLCGIRHGDELEFHFCSLS